MYPCGVTPYRILVFQSDDSLGPLLRRHLKQLGFVSCWKPYGPQAITAVEEFEPHLILLELKTQTTEEDGVLAALRSKTTVPIIVLSSVDEEEAGLQTFKGGADDYVVKPFTTSLLMARIVAHLRRSYGYEHHEPVPKTGSDHFPASKAK